MNRWQANAGKVVRVGRNTFYAEATEYGPVTVVMSADPQPDNRREASARELLRAHARQCVGIELPLPKVICSMPGVASKHQQVWLVVSEYLPGADLNEQARCADRPAWRAIGHAAGLALGQLHWCGTTARTCNRHQLPAGQSDNAVEPASVLTAIDKPLARLVSATRIAGLGRRQVEQLQALLQQIMPQFREPAGESVYSPQMTTIHADLHGGNVIACDPTKAVPRRAALIDAKLIDGDCAYDLASIQNWVTEVLDAHHRHLFLNGLRAGYASSNAHCHTTPATWWLYQTARSLGRLAYYVPTRREWTEPHGPQRLARHLRRLGTIPTFQLAGTHHHRIVDAASLLVPHSQAAPLPPIA